jgi:hypothetical protein
MSKTIPMAAKAPPMNDRGGNEKPGGYCHQPDRRLAHSSQDILIVSCFDLICIFNA